MRAHDYVRIAGAALLASPVRTCLTMLGIVIGVASMVSMAAIGAGAKAKVSEQIRSFGANVIMVNASASNRGRPDAGSGVRRPLSLDDAEAISGLETVRQAAPSVAGAARMVHGNANWGTTVNGTTREHFAIRGWHLAEGRLFTADEEKRAGQVVVIGAVVARKLFEDEDPVGRVVRILGTPLEVVGVLSEKGTSGGGESQDDVAFVPLRTAKNRLIGGGNGDRNAVGYILASAVSSDTIPAATEEIDDLMQQRHHVENRDDKDFSVSTAASIVAAQEASTRTVATLLGAVACVSLLVGGISIMNIMLVSVTERTHEIGIRMAVGAKRRDILTQFLLEAVVLSTLGGFCGVVVGLVVTRVVAGLASWPTIVPPGVVILAVLFSGAVGVFFGFYPARKAARLDPIQALHAE
jgi:putative ABC transport system permease protein